MIYDSLTHAWVKTLAEAVHWNRVTVRGKHTRESLGHTIVFPMKYPILASPERNLSYSFMYAEAWWILSGRNQVNDLTAFAPSIKRFSDDGIRMSGAYGPKIVDQISWVVETLGNDPSSRQAVINIWRERPGPSKDIPCTLSAQFIIRDQHLHLFVTMRSSDVWLGLPYDVFTFTMLALLVGIELNTNWGMSLKFGNCHHTAASRHVYESDIEKVLGCNQTHVYLQGWDHGPEIDLQLACEVFPDQDSFLLGLHNQTPKLRWLSM